MAHWLIAIGLVAAQTEPAQTDVPAMTQAPAAGVQETVREGEMTKADAEALIATCGPRKFESAAQFNNGGKLRRAKILLCAKHGETDEQWIATLEKAASKVVMSPELSIEAKAKIAGELQAEIARLRKPN